MRLGLISDVHFGPRAFFDGKLRKLSHAAGELTRAFVAEMNQREKPDLVVNLGDVIEDQDRELDREHYAEFLHALAALECEVVHVAGNHDLIHLGPAELTTLWGGGYGLFHSHDRQGFHLVVLTARHRGRGREERIELPPEQLSWFRDDLERTVLPTVLFMHHPVGEMALAGNRWFERDPQLCLVQGRSELRTVLEQSGKVVAVFSGHAHWNYLSVVGGLPYLTLQSLTENIDEDSPGRPARSAAVVDLDPERILVRVLGEQPARYEFHARNANAGAGPRRW